MKLALVLFTGILGMIVFPSYAQIDHCFNDRYAQLPTFDSLEIEQSIHTYSIEQIWPSTTIDTLELEIFQPSGSVDPLNERPFILMIFGGGFLSGNRHDMDYFAIEMARRGFVTATMDYRLGWDCNPSSPAAICFECGSEALKLRVSVYRAIQDARAALNYVVENSAQFGVDTSQIFLQGTSAGAITALHTAFMDQIEADSYCPTCVTELGELHESGLTQVHPFSIKGVINNCGAVSSLGIMDNANIPVVGFHDEWDCTVPYQGGNFFGCLGCTAFQYGSGSDAIRSKLNTDGVCYGMNRVMANLDHCSYPSNAIIGKASCFIKSILCGTCTSYITTSIWDIPDCMAGTVTMGIDDKLIDPIEIYPNPTMGKVIINSEETIVSLELSSLNGRVVETLSENINSIDLSGLQQGLYMLKIRMANNKTNVRRIVKN